MKDFLIGVFISLILVFSSLFYFINSKYSVGLFANKNFNKSTETIILSKSKILKPNLVELKFEPTNETKSDLEDIINTL